MYLKLLIAIFNTKHNLQNNILQKYKYLDKHPNKNLFKIIYFK